MSATALIILADNINPGKGTYAHPYSSTTGVSAQYILIFTAIALLLLLYLIVRVWWSLRKNKARYGNWSKRKKKN